MTGTRLSASFDASIWAFDFEAREFFIIDAILYVALCSPTCSAQTLSLPSFRIVPDTVLSPLFFLTYTASPLIDDSSIKASPLITVPSIGIVSPAFTMTMSPTFREPKSIFISTPFRSTQTSLMSGVSSD